MTDALASYATILKAGDGGSPENFATIAEVLDIGGPSLASEIADVTSHSSPNGWREKIATLLDGGEVTFDVNFIPGNATHSATTGLVADFKARTRRNYQLVFPDVAQTTWEFTAIVSAFEPSAPVDGALTASVTLTISGQPTLN